MTGELLTFDGWTPKRWSRLDDDAHSSTVAFFQGGFRRRDNNEEVVVWSGVPDGEGGYHIEGDPEEVEEDDKFIVEHHTSTGVQATYHAEPEDVNKMVKTIIENSIQE